MRNRKIYFLGIGGIGMSALAQYFMQEGCEVHGYDLTPSPITDMLSRKGAHIHFEPDVDAIPDDIELAVFTPAIHPDFPEYRHLEAMGVRLLKRSQVLGIVTDKFRTIAVAGTHGKTTTTSMVEHILHGIPNTLLAFIGGISKNIDDNYYYEKRSGSSGMPISVVEADEYDRSFLTLHPAVSVITSVDADHLDIYKNDSNLEAAFQQFANQSEYMIVEEKVNDKITKDPAKKLVYGLSDSCDCRPFNIRHSGENTIFDLHTPFVVLKDLRTNLHGIYNILNFTAAISAFLLIKEIGGLHSDNAIDLQDFVGEKTSSFLGVKRRFDYIVKRDDMVFIDDYAHHPNEMRSFFNAVRELYPGKKVCGVFQPHLYSRTRDFADDFAGALSLLDKVILLPIYPAREAPIEGIDSEFLLGKIPITDKLVLQKGELAGHLKENRPEVLLTVGAGDIDRLVPLIAEALSE